MKLHDFCSKFQHSIVFLFEIILYAACLATFFLMFAIDNPEIIVMSRTAAVTLSTFVIMLFLLTFMYGKYDIGHRKWGQVALSVSITLIITDLITYLELSIMKTNEANNTTFKLENIGILFLVFIIQIIVIVAVSAAGEAFYFWINPKEKCLVITGDETDAARVAMAMSSFDRKYGVSDIVSYKDPDLENKMVAADTIVLYELPVSERYGIINFCYQNLKNIYFNPHIADILEQNSHPVIVDDIALFSTRYHMITFEERLVKRFMDTFISLIALIITSPILLVSAICIKKQDGGSVFFKQKRATVHGRVFEIIKFRTMKENVENFSSTEGDGRITKVGRILRKYRIDELPQFVNILKGDMSLVGPRPEMLENVADYEKELPEFRYRLRMKAGLTGYAQIYGKYNTTSRDKLMLDLMYIENYSLVRDLQLLFQTILVLFKAEDSTEAFKNDGRVGNDTDKEA
ncbi:MAG: exopolysaccharide biosynthesis polyprenyl glycosylphosphotransferase [Lachnospiraceae bacterium]|nr:exopolysaccharide biosynthesis polyprenyl glycosylphosphotransferase [Lachnospiraceae bacterium]